jgi:antitoxin ParD1/3/4
MEASMEKICISLTSSQLQLVNDAVKSGDYASSSEVLREALREWKAKRLLGQLWDEGIASGDVEHAETIEDIKAAARQRA